MFVRSLALFLGISLFSLPVTAQVTQPSPQPKPTSPEAAQLQVGELEFMNSIRREQVVKLAHDIEELDSHLKWVLDNWVAKPKSK